MRKFLFSILLASVAATPALADHPDRSDRDQARAERQQAREDRQQVREERVERPQQVVRQQSQNNGAGGNAVVRTDRRNVEQVRDTRADQRQQRVDNRDQRFQQRVDNRNVQFQQRVDNRALRYRQPPVVTQQVPVSTYHPRTTSGYGRHDSNVHWNTNWRHDRRYDWHNYRNRHRSIFHLGFYYDPFGYGYSPFNIGFQLRPAYYSQSFWFDPAMYGLPFPPPGTQWVRYWNDAVLVDVYSGEVVDVIHNFFW